MEHEHSASKRVIKYNDLCFQSIAHGQEGIWETSQEKKKPFRVPSCTGLCGPYGLIGPIIVHFHFKPLRSECVVFNLLVRN